MIDWHWRTFQQLTPHELEALLRLRQAVFVIEQACLYPDIDGRDSEAHHLFALQAQQMLACLRLFPPADSHQPCVLGRLCVAAATRRQGLGTLAMQQALDYCRQHWPQHGVRLSAQAHLQAFYRPLGFRPRGEPYDEDGIPHISMVLTGHMPA